MGEIAIGREKMKRALMILLALVILAMGVVLAVILLNRQSPELSEQAETVPVAAPVQPTETLPAETEPVCFTEVPLYFQTDYPYTRYGNNTIATSGCSITSLAMVATYLTDHEYLPDELVYHFGSYGVNNIERLEHAIEVLGLPCEQNYDWQQTKDALKEGKVAIVMVDERSEFSNGQHFIVLAGITEKGRILVNDPAGYNYRKAHLAEYFEEGFPEHMVVAGLEGSWVFDKEAVPQDLELFDASKPTGLEGRYKGVDPIEQDKYLLACFVWAAAREKSPETQQAVAEVILNRVITDLYPKTVDAVMRQDDFYKYYKAMQGIEPEMEQYLAVTNALYGPHVLPADVTAFYDWNYRGDLWGELEGLRFFYEEGNVG